MHVKCIYNKKAIRAGKGKLIQSKVILKWEMYSMGGKKVLDLGKVVHFNWSHCLWDPAGCGKDRELSCVVLGFESKGLIIVWPSEASDFSPGLSLTWPDVLPVPPSHSVGSVASHLVKWPSAHPGSVLSILLWPFQFCFLPDPQPTFEWFWTQFFS